MNQTRKIAALLMAAMMTIPAVSCKKNPNPGAEGSTQPQESETLQLNTDEAKNIQMDLAFKEVEGIIENAENPEETQPSVSISQGEDGSLYVQKTDINHQVVTQENGDAATELYTGTTLATKVPSPEYQPSYKTYFSMWLDMTNTPGSVAKAFLCGSNSPSMTNIVAQMAPVVKCVGGLCWRLTRHVGSSRIRHHTRHLCHFQLDFTRASI